MDIARRLELLEEENTRLRDEIDMLREALIEPTMLPIELRLTTHEAALVGHLLARDICTKQSCLAATSAVDILGDQPDIKIIDVYICKVRKKLAPFGIEIVTRWGVGYAMPAESKKILREMGGMTAQLLCA